MHDPAAFIAGLPKAELRNSFLASFLPEAEKARHCRSVDESPG